MLMSGLLCWLSGKESICQCRRYGFDPWVGRIPYTAEELSLCATASEPVLWSPGATRTEARMPGALLHDERGHCSEKQMPRS